MGREDKSNSKKKHKKDKKAKKKNKKSKKSKPSHSNSDSSSESEEWVEKEPLPKSTEKLQEKDISEFLDFLPTYTRKDFKDVKDEERRKKKKNIDDYNPGTSSRELNPYWKDGGKGLPMEPEPAKKPAFKRPDETLDSVSSQPRSTSYLSGRNQHNWRKRDNREEPIDHSPENSPPHEGTSDNIDKTEINHTNETKQDGFLTDHEMNALGARIVKAEILGNKSLVAELNSKLVKARERKKTMAGEREHVTLSVSDSQGNVRPLMKTEKASASRGNKRRADTHARDGFRDKYFPDDDKYSLDRMFVNEKYETGERDEKQFMKAVSKHTNPNDNLDDIYEEDITRNKSEKSQDEKARSRAISDHQRLQRSMESCNRCVESSMMKKHLIVSMCGNVYLSLPETKSLTVGHCIISTTHHHSCGTFIDEDIWSQIADYRKALTRMFESDEKDVVFFETVKSLEKRPHFELHCVPMPRDVGDTAPIYFKKAISECEMEWSNNKKVIDLKGADLRRGVPKGLPYFWVHFGMDMGFAHVIEDSRLFPDKFAEEILGGILDLDHRSWRKSFKENFESQLKKVKEFLTLWKPYEEDVKH